MRSTDHDAHSSGFHQYRGIYLKRIPTYSFALILEVMQELGVDHQRVLKNTGLQSADVSREGTLVSFIQALKPTKPFSRVRWSLMRHRIALNWP